jgi:hypothetical protein
MCFKNQTNDKFAILYPKVKYYYDLNVLELNTNWPNRWQHLLQSGNLYDCSNN